MSTKENGLEVKVGLFICIGFAVIAAMILKFGLGGSQGFKKYYPLVVDLPNADGLLKGSDVLLAGARIGYVATKPDLTDNLGNVRVTVSISDKYAIPKESTFTVDSSGLLGDKFIAIGIPKGFDPKTFNPKDPAQAWQKGDHIQGVSKEGIETVLEEAGPALKKLSAELDDLQEATAKLKNGVLGEDNLNNVKMTLANLKTTSDNFAQASKGIGPIVTGAQDAVDSAKKTLVTVDGAADNLHKVLDEARDAIQKVTHGDGLIAAMLTNREMMENFKALVVNLREHGVLFYHDSNKGNAEPSPSPAGAKKKR